MNALIFFSSFIESDTLTQIPDGNTNDFFFANLDFEYHTARSALELIHVR